MLPLRVSSAEQQVAVVQALQCRQGSLCSSCCQYFAYSCNKRHDMATPACMHSSAHCFSLSATPAVLLQSQDPITPQMP